MDQWPPAMQYQFGNPLHKYQIVIDTGVRQDVARFLAEEQKRHKLTRQPGLGQAAIFALYQTFPRLREITDERLRKNSDSLRQSEKPSVKGPEQESF